MKQGLALRKKDFALYCMISAAVVGTVIAVAESNANWDLFLKLFCLLGFTAIIFYYFIQSSRRLWHKQSFWALTSSFALVHFAGCVAVVMHLTTVKPLWFAASWVELLIFVVLKEWLFAGFQRTEIMKR
jgi:hypothetical protein